jgi:hypothetical protein
VVVVLVAVEPVGGVLLRTELRVPCLTLPLVKVGLCVVVVVVATCCTGCLCLSGVLPWKRDRALDDAMLSESNESTCRRTLPLPLEEEALVEAAFLVLLLLGLERIERS